MKHKYTRTITMSDGAVVERTPENIKKAQEDVQKARNDAAAKKAKAAAAKKAKAAAAKQAKEAAEADPNPQNEDKTS